MNFFKRFRNLIPSRSTHLGRQWAWGLGLIVAFLVVATSLNDLYLSQIHQGLEQLEENLTEQKFLGQLSFQIASCQEWEEQIWAFRQSPAQQAQAVDAWHTASQGLLATLEATGDQVPCAAHLPHLSEWKELAQHYVDSVLMGLEENTGVRSASSLGYHPESLASGQRALENLRRRVEIEQTQVQTAGETLIHRVRFLFSRHVQWTAAWTVVTLGCVGIAGLWVGGYVLGRVRVLTEATRRLAVGPKPIRLKGTYQDELGQLAHQLNLLSEKLFGASPSEDLCHSNAPSVELLLSQHWNPAFPTLQGRVLLAEDGSENQRLIGFILRKAGLEVAIASDGQEAVQRVLHSMDSGSAEQPYDLILMDMLMPQMDGFQAVRHLRQAGYQGPILAITGLSENYSREQCLEVGCNEYLVKPLKREKLLALVAQYLRVAPEEPTASTDRPRGAVSS